MSNLNEAVSRLKRHIDFGGHESVGQIYGADYVAPLSDASTVVQAYLDEHMVDDDEAITEEWLRSVAMHCRDNGSFVIGFSEHRFVVELVIESWMVRKDQIPIHIINTRGELRLLCKALGVGMNEKSK
jgi:hypothetical protein